MGEVLIVALSLYAFAMVSNRLSMSPITAPMVFTTIGLIVGTGGLGWFDLDLEAVSVSILVEATLVLVLFTDAIRIDLRALRHQATFPARLLAIGLPLAIVFGTIVAVLLFDELTWPEAALVAAVLAPTDAALGQAVVSNQRLPVRIRQGLNAESGLNDGIMVPVVTVLLAIAAVASLTIIRMVPALIGMTGSGTLLETRLFVGWFGPRGLASILFALFVLEHLDGPNTPTIFLIATWTVLASIYAHGLTASPWARHLAARLADAPATMPEMHPVEEMPTRR